MSYRQYYERYGMDNDVVIGFNYSQLTSDYSDWKNIVELSRKNLNNDMKEWLSSWELWDLACSPMSDEERKLIRYGHHLGWFHNNERNS